jgi:hypothetical protein
MNRTSTMGRSTLACVAFVALTVAACGHGNGHIGPSPWVSGPAFSYTSYHQFSCGPDTCAKVGVLNVGHTPGAGRCHLSGAVGGGTGPSVQLPVIRPNKSVTIVLRWSGAVVPSGGLLVLCEPGLRS